MLIALNRQARAEYEIIETLEAGISLLGSEVKSLRNRQSVSFKDSFVKIKGSEAWLYNLYISPYSKATIVKPEPLRDRKLLLHKSEITRLSSKVQQKGYSIIPLELYFKKGLVKVKIALVRGKTTKDRREEIRKKDLERELSRELKSGKLKL
ncbi:MAG: SsrA-binding protein SmpB [Aquificaceae bacterium]